MGSRRYSSLIAQCLRPYIQSFRAELVGSVPGSVKIVIIFVETTLFC
jgi:hypothetical protein